MNSRLLAYAVEEAYHGLLMTGKHPVAVLDISLPPGEVDVNIHPAKSEVKFRNEADVFRDGAEGGATALVAQMPVPRIDEVAAPYKARLHPALEQLWVDLTDAAKPAPSPKSRPP